MNLAPVWVSLHKTPHVRQDTFWSGHLSLRSPPRPYRGLANFHSNGFVPP